VLGAVPCEQCSKHQLWCRECLYIRTKTLVFVEVKLRRGTGFGDPLEAVTPRKQQTLRSVAEHYLYARRAHYDTLRFDVIGILADRPKARLLHVEDAF
jgi:putative endonuclease